MNVYGHKNEFLQTEYYYTDTLLKSLIEKSESGDSSDVEFVYKTQKMLDACITFLKNLSPEKAVEYVRWEIDRFEKNKDPEDPAIRCSKGCSFCCYINVDITEPEAVILSGQFKKYFSQTDLLERQEKADDGPNGWNKLPYQDRACVFLNQETSECRIYHERPIACRLHVVMTPPEMCDSERYSEGKIGRLFNYRLEIIQSAMLNVFKSGSIPQMVLKELAR